VPWRRADTSSATGASSRLTTRKVIATGEGWRMARPWPIAECGVSSKNGLTGRVEDLQSPTTIICSWRERVRRGALAVAVASASILTRPPFVLSVLCGQPLSFWRRVK
jgi:hypothetical protein